MIQCYTSALALDQRADDLKEFLYRMGHESRQGAIGLVVDRDYLEIGFPLEQPASPRPKRRKR